MNINWEQIEEVATLISILLFSNIVSFMVNLVIMARLHNMTEDYSE